MNAVAFSPDGRLAATGGEDTTVRLGDVTAGTMVAEPLTGHTAPVTAVAFPPDELLIGSGGRDSTVRLWNVAGGSGSGQPHPHREAIPHRNPAGWGR